MRISFVLKIERGEILYYFLLLYKPIIFHFTRMSFHGWIIGSMKTLNMALISCPIRLRLKCVSFMDRNVNFY